MAGLLLACTFVMPAIDGCHGPVSPFVATWAAVSDSANSALAPRALLSNFTPLVAPYLFGMLLFLHALASLRHRRAIWSVTQKWIVVLLALVLISLGIEWPLSNIPGTAWVPFPIEGFHISAALVLSCIYLLRTFRRRQGGELCLRWYAGVCCVAWFSHWIATEETWYGLQLSWLASIVIAWACLQEASVWAGQRIWGTLWLLVQGRVRICNPDEPQCAECGYLLVGLTGLRCPECGQEFAWEADEVRTVMTTVKLD